jgi:hypothetical protein
MSTKDYKISAGDILCGDIGYSMSIPVFYKVISLTSSGKSAKIARLEAIDCTDDGFTGTRMPSTKFSARDTKAYTRRINTSDYFGEYVALNGHNLYQWNGKAKYFDYLD